MVTCRRGELPSLEIKGGADGGSAEDSDYPEPRGLALLSLLEPSLSIREQLSGLIEPPKLMTAWRTLAECGRSFRADRRPSLLYRVYADGNAPRASLVLPIRNCFALKRKNVHDA